MPKSTYVLSFPSLLVGESITYRLVKDFDIEFNILKADVKPNVRGTLVLQLKGKKENVGKGLEYLSSLGIEWKAISKDIAWDKTRCIHCTACTSLCPSDALSLDRKTMKVSFKSEKCIACEMCLKVCSYKAITLDI